MLSHRVNDKNVINMCSAIVTPAVVLATLLQSGLCWEMHYAQVFALEMSALMSTTVLETEITYEQAKELMPHVQPSVTLMGIPVKIDNERYPKSLIRLMRGDVELSRIENLAVLGAVMGDSYYTEEDMKRERDKFVNLTYKGDL